MESLQVKSNSWLYKLVSLTDNEHMPSDLCSFFWLAIRNFLGCMMFLSIIGLTLLQMYDMISSVSLHSSVKSENVVERELFEPVAVPVKTVDEKILSLTENDKHYKEVWDNNVQYERFDQQFSIFCGFMQIFGPVFIFIFIWMETKK